MYICGLIPWNIAELAEAVPIDYEPWLDCSYGNSLIRGHSVCNLGYQSTSSH